MLTIKTKPDCTLVFQEYGGKLEREFLTKIVEGIDEGNTPVVIGKLSEITEDQAKELVAFYSGEDKGKGYKDYDTKRPEWYEFASNSLLSAAEEVGIPETDFDKYLVIKL